MLDCSGINSHVETIGHAFPRYNRLHMLMLKWEVGEIEAHLNWNRDVDLASLSLRFFSTMLANGKLLVFASLLAGTLGQPLENENDFNSTECRCVSTLLCPGYATPKADTQFCRSPATSVGPRVPNGTTSTIFLGAADCSRHNLSRSHATMAQKRT